MLLTRTWDRHSNRRIERLHPLLKPKVYEMLGTLENEFDLRVRVTSGLRSLEEQQDLYNMGRTSPGVIVTHARPWESMHNYGLAFDVVEIGPDRGPVWRSLNWDLIGEIGESLGLTWGGRWESKDRPHFELPLPVLKDFV